MKTAQEAALEMVIAVGQAIRELGGIPNGHLYTRLMGTLSLDEYNAIVAKLQEAKLISIDNHFITWIGD